MRIDIIEQLKQDIENIRKLLLDGVKPLDLSITYKCNKSVIYNIKNNKTY